VTACTPHGVQAFCGGYKGDDLNAGTDAASLILPGDGLCLAADAAGPQTGVPVVLLHGGGQTRDAWGGAMLGLAQRGFRAYAVDLRGHGDSDWAPDGDYHIDRLAADLRSVAAYIGRPAIYVGASLGGIAALIALGEPPSVDALGLVLVDVSPHLLPDGVGAILDFMRDTSFGFDSLDDAADAIARYLPHRPRPKDFTGLRKNLRLRADGRYYWHWDPRTLEYILDPANMNERMEHAARNIHCPALLVRGESSELVSAQVAQDFMGRFPNGATMDIEGARHMVAGDSNSMFREALINFIVVHTQK
jgi:pimeloyl-ACP methyl ester carboxylesterase